MLKPVMFLALILFIALIGAILYRLLIRFKAVEKLWISMKKELFWNSFIRPGLESFMELIMALAIRLMAFNLGSFSEGISSIAATLIFCIAVLAPIVVYIFLYRMYHKPIDKRIE